MLSTTTNRLHKITVPAGSTYVNDHSSNVVYLITCNKCKLQYVGETSQNPNKRFTSHNSCFRNPTAYFFCKILNHILSVLLKTLRGQDVQTEVLWICS